MSKSLGFLPWVAWAGIALCAAPVTAVTIPVDSSNGAAWARSDGGTGTAMVQGGPAIWNSMFTAAIPPGATNISFQLDSFLVDDKGVVQLNGTTIADAVIQRPNGAAAGAGTFDFGLGGGNQAYNFVGFTPGAVFSLPDGTTNATIKVYVNDTGVVDPLAPPLTETFISSFSFSGSLTYEPAAIGRAQTIPTLSEWAVVALSLLLGVLGLSRSRTRRAAPR